MNSMEKTKEKSLSWLLCAVTALGVLACCTRSSFMYPFNDWVDPNCFYTVGKGIVHGLVPYRDLLEQKGPLLYFIHSLGYLLSRNSFFGVYLLEAAAATVFLYFSGKSLSLYAGKRALLAIPVLALVIYTSKTFVHGDSAEEFALPLLAWDLWVVLKAGKEGKNLAFGQWFAIGLRAGCVFWIKFTMVGGYVGLFLYQSLWLLTRRRGKTILPAVGAVVLGVLVSTVPYLLYFGIHGAVRDWLEVYLYNNLFLYGSASAGLLYNIYGGLATLAKTYFGCGVLCFLGFGWLLYKDWKNALQLVSIMAFTFLFVYIGGAFRLYYAFVFGPFVVLGFAPVLALMDRVIPADTAPKAWMAWGLAVVSIALSGVITPNRAFMAVEKSQLPQYQFREVIRQEENPTLLNYGFLDGGFYTVCDVLPTTRAFCKLNIQLSEMIDQQEQVVRDGLVDFIVTREQTLDTPLYTCVMQGEYPSGDVKAVYYLYQRIK